MEDTRFMWQTIFGNFYRKTAMYIKQEGILVEFQTFLESLWFIVNNFEHVWEAGPLSCTQGSRALYTMGLGTKTLYRREGALYRDLHPMNRMTDGHTWLKTLPSPLRWRAVIISISVEWKSGKILFSIFGCKVWFTVCNSRLNSRKFPGR